MAGPTCACGDGDATLIYACAGCSNLGQMTLALGLRLAAEDRGSMSCLAGVGAHIPGLVLSARECQRNVVLDGCAQRCAGRIFEHLEITPFVHLVLTEEGFKKKHGVGPDPDDIERAHAITLARLEGGA